jgi:murein L,D-transpeptidase YcbB/YkuD
MRNINSCLDISLPRRRSMSARKLVQGAGFALAAVLLTGCASFAPSAPVGDLEQILLSRSEARTSDAAALVDFYQKRNFRPAWTGDEEAEARAGVVRAALARADEHGLVGDDYAVAPPDDRRDRTALAEHDIALTGALFRYARDVRVGRVRPNDIYKDVGLPQASFDAGSDLERALRTNTVAVFLAGLPPPHAEYRRLAAAMVRYRDIAGKGGWPTLRANADTRALRARLAFEDPALAADTNVTAAELKGAIARFQARHGLDDDGLVGPNTIAALNVPVAARVRQIAANMERWRWLPRQFERRYIAVDVPAQSLVFVQDGKAALTSRVIVGRKETTTPILRTMVAAIVASPPWNIPGDISARDLLPKLKLDPNYLATRNMVLVDGARDDPHGRKVDWKKETPTQMSYRRIRELPGPNNGLGQIMLDMPNDFDVYLHDTPGKEIFAEEERTISNGCIRVQEIFALASLALTSDAREGLPRLRAATAARQTQRLPVENPLPVYLLYWTAAADEEGAVSFRWDPYERDRPLLAAMGGGASLRAAIN